MATTLKPGTMPCSIQCPHSRIECGAPSKRHGDPTPQVQNPQWRKTLKPGTMPCSIVMPTQLMQTLVIGTRQAAPCRPNNQHGPHHPRRQLLRTAPHGIVWLLHSTHSSFQNFEGAIVKWRAAAAAADLDLVHHAHILHGHGHASSGDGVAVSHLLIVMVVAALAETVPAAGTTAATRCGQVSAQRIDGFRWCIATLGTNFGS
jgi:hypothetical protein